MEAVKNRIEKVFRAVFKNEALEIFGSTTATDVPGWDSITHLELIVAVEKEFGIEITGFDVMNLKNVGDLINLVQRKISSRP